VSDAEPGGALWSNGLAYSVIAWSCNDHQIFEYAKTEPAGLVDAGEPLVEELRRKAITLAGRVPQEALVPRGDGDDPSI